MFRINSGLALYAVINDGSPNSSMFSHRMVTLNLPIQSIGIVVGPLLSPPSAPPPIAADSRSVENNEDENEEVDDEVEEEDGGFEEPFLGGAA